MPSPQIPQTGQLFVAISLLISLMAEVAAHEYWIEKAAQRYTLNQGHQTATHAGESTVPYDPAIVTQAQCVDSSGQVRSIKPQAAPVWIEADCAAVVFRIDSGYWSKTPYDTFNKPRNEVKGVLQSWRTEETVMRIERWSAPLARHSPPGLMLTLPADPTTLKNGDKFTVIVRLNGKPVANVPVAYSGETRGSTDEAGRINLRVRHSGMQILSASHETPLNDGKADTVIRGANLNFLVP